MKPQKAPKCFRDNIELQFSGEKRRKIIRNIERQITLTWDREE
jgi:hypothetical protein